MNVFIADSVSCSPVDPKEDVEAFYKENSDQVWLVINDRINEIDLAPKQKKSEKSYIAELQPVLQLLGAFIDRCLVVKYSTYQKELGMWK